MTAPRDVEAFAEVLAAHGHWKNTAGWIGSPAPSDWGNIAAACNCGERIHDAVTPPWPHSLTDAHRAHVAAALLASPALAALVARERAEALREAADHFDRYDVVTIGDSDIGSNMIPLSPADRLRARADQITTTTEEGPCS